MSNRPRRRLLANLRLRAVLFAGLGNELDSAATLDDFRAETRRLFRNMIAIADDNRRARRPFDPLAD